MKIRTDSEHVFKGCTGTFTKNKIQNLLDVDHSDLWEELLSLIAIRPLGCVKFTKVRKGIALGMM